MLFLALETYVDPSAGYEGSCYRVAGWQELGLTKGFVLPEEVRTSTKYYLIKNCNYSPLSRCAPMVTVRCATGRALEQPDRDGLATIFPSCFLGGE